MSRVLTICQDCKARMIDFEAKNVILETALTGIPASLYIGQSWAVYGLTNGQVEVWEIGLSWAWRMLFVEDVSETGDSCPVIDVNWVFLCRRRLT